MQLKATTTPKHQRVVPGHFYPRSNRLNEPNTNFIILVEVMDPQQANNDVVGVGKNDVAGGVELTNQLVAGVKLKDDNSVQANLLYFVFRGGDKAGRQNTKVECMRKVTEEESENSVL